LLAGNATDAENQSVRRIGNTQRGGYGVDVPEPAGPDDSDTGNCRSSTARYPEIQIDMGVSDRIVDMIDENVDVRGYPAANWTDLSLMPGGWLIYSFGRVRAALPISKNLRTDQNTAANLEPLRSTTTVGFLLGAHGRVSAVQLSSGLAIDNLQMSQAR